MLGRYRIPGAVYIVQLLLASTVSGAADCEQSLSSDLKGEEICQNVGDVYDVMGCFQENLSEARQNLENTIAKLKEFWKPGETDSLKTRDTYNKNINNFMNSHKSWEIYANEMCNIFLLDYWMPGSMYKTETIKCMYLLTVEREKLIRTLFRRQLKFIEKND